MKYNVHFMGYYGYDVEVEANDKDEARDKAYGIFDNLSDKEFCKGASFYGNGTDVEEVNE